MPNISIANNSSLINFLAKGLQCCSATELRRCTDSRYNNLTIGGFDRSPYFITYKGGCNANENIDKMHYGCHSEAVITSKFDGIESCK